MSTRNAPKLQLQGLHPDHSKTVSRGRANIDVPPPLPSRRQTWHRSSAPPIQESVLSPDIIWEPGMFSVDYILRNLPFPRVVSCDHGSCSRSSSFGFDCSQMLLLYSKNDGVKISAKSLAVNSSDGKTLMDTNDRLVIPEDYKGWFAVIGLGRTLPPIPFYKHVGQLAISDCHTFLIGGSKNVTTVQKAGGTINSRELYPGDVLRKGTLDESQKLLHCTDENDRDVFLPVETQGTFYVIKNTTRVNKVPVMQIKEIMSTMKFPCTVKLIHGREPTDAGVFTKLMTLEEVIQDNSILASTVFKPRNTLHELMTDMPNKFKVAVPNKKLLQSPAYISALNLCLDKGDLFMRNIKLTRFTQVNTPIKGRRSAIGYNFNSPPVTQKEVMKPKGEVKGQERTSNPYAPFPSLKTDRTVSQNSKSEASHQTDIPSPRGNSVREVSNANVKQLVSNTTQTEDTTPSSAPVSFRRSNTWSGEPTGSEELVPGDDSVIINTTQTVDSNLQMQLKHLQSDENQRGAEVFNKKCEVNQVVEEIGTDIHGDSDGAKTKVSDTKKKPRPNAYEEIWSTNTSVLGSQVRVQNPADLNDSVEVQKVLKNDGTGADLSSSSEIQEDSIWNGQVQKDESSCTPGRFMSKIVVDRPKSIQDDIRLVPEKKQEAIFPEEPDEFVDDVVENDTPLTPSDIPKLRQKKVSFSDILDVRSFPKQHVTTINHVAKGHEKRIHNDAEQHMHGRGTEYDDHGYSQIEIFPEVAAGNDDYPKFVSEPFATRDPSSGEDEMGYLIPKLTRKGRVKLEKDIDKKSKENNVAKTLSLPKLTVAESREMNARSERRRSTETEKDVLW